MSEFSPAAFNDILLSNDEIDRFIAEREDSEHANVKPASWFIEPVIQHFEPNAQQDGDVFPWPKTHNLFQFRHSEVTIWNGVNGHGKSLVLGQVIWGFTKSRRCCMASLEMKPVTTLARMGRQSLGGRHPSQPYIREFLNGLNGRLWLYDQQGTVKSEKLLGVMYYAAEKLLVEHFVIDSLMKCGIGEDDYNRQKSFVDQLCAFAKDTECHVHLVTHAKKGDDEYAMPGKMSVKGSGSITDQVDNVLNVWRNKKKEIDLTAANLSDEKKEALLDKPDAMILCDKQRNGEHEPRIALWYERDSMRYVESASQKRGGLF